MMVMRGSYRAQPSAMAAADCAWPDTSSTSSTGQPKRAAISALAPVRPGSPAMPSNRPMEPSAMTRSAPLPSAAASAWSRRIVHGEAVEVEARVRRWPPRGRRGRYNPVRSSRPRTRKPRRAKGALEAQRDGRLAGAGARRGDEQSGTRGRSLTRPLPNAWRSRWLWICDRKAAIAPMTRMAGDRSAPAGDEPRQVAEAGFQTSSSAVVAA